MAEMERLSNSSSKISGKSFADREDVEIHALPQQQQEILPPGSDGAIQMEYIVNPIQTKKEKKERSRKRKKEESRGAGKCFNSTWKRISFTVILLLCCGVGVALGVIWRNKTKKSKNEMKNNVDGNNINSNGYIFPDESSKQRFDLFHSLIVMSGATSTQDLEFNNNKPQFYALLWLSLHDTARLDLSENDINNEFDSSSQVQSILERYALAVFYFYTNDDIVKSGNPDVYSNEKATMNSDWTKNDKWITSPDSICTWYGVDCNETAVTLPSSGQKINTLWMTNGSGGVFSEEGVVTSLTLPLNNLRGEIPSELKLLKHLAFLDLRGNLLEGNLPIQLLNLDELIVMDLSSNKLKNSIPPTLGQLSEIREIHLNDNLFGGDIPTSLKDLTNLEILNLEKNKNLSGSIPDILCDNNVIVEVDDGVQCNCC